MPSPLLLFSGTSNPPLAGAVARHLGIPLSPSEVERFPDGELSVRLPDDVRGQHVFVLQPTTPPVNDHLVELLQFADAARRGGAERIIAVVPYFGYSRADRRSKPGQSIAASMVAKLLEAVGVDHVITVDLHTPQIEGFFLGSVDVLSAVPLLCDALRPHLPPDTVVVSPDAGRAQMATHYAARLALPLAIIHKRRESARHTVATDVVGDVAGRPCLLVDDIISSGSTVVTGLDALTDARAKSEFYVAATHALLVEDARQKLTRPDLLGLFTTDTVPHGTHWPTLQITSVAPLLAQAIDASLPTP